ncbi:MBL fold metallo-hydrolase [Dactylosporangium sp. NPDC050588]|uniref:MBL fold metallo-hydrolase n=1 Tax=Dactylosporangium sp. NPDC050588 TaxID=3157211 RepID=UPI0033FAE864
MVDSYLVESADGVVLIDANLLQSDVRALSARIAALRKPLLGAFVTHAHPDHLNGLPLPTGDDVAVHAAADVADTIARIADAKRAQWQPVHGDAANTADRLSGAAHIPHRPDPKSPSQYSRM